MLHTLQNSNRTNITIYMKKSSSFHYYIFFHFHLTFTTFFIISIKLQNKSGKYKKKHRQEKIRISKVNSKHFQRVQV